MFVLYDLLTCYNEEKEWLWGEGVAGGRAQMKEAKGEEHEARIQRNLCFQQIPRQILHLSRAIVAFMRDYSAVLTFCCRNNYADT